MQLSVACVFMVGIPVSVGASETSKAHTDDQSCPSNGCRVSGSSFVQKIKPILSQVLDHQGVVQTKCKDDNPSCGSWAGSGECTKNPAYMHQDCKLSCNKCLASGDSSGNQNGGAMGGGSRSSQTCAAFTQWPQIKGGVTCSGCTALVSTGSNGGRCDTYCQSFGHECVSAAEEQNNNCKVKYTSSCNQAIVGTSDMLCTCRKPSSVKPSTSIQGNSGTGVVQTNCKDDNPMCGSWAGSAECTKNPVYMHQNCKLSCNKCSASGGSSGNQNAGAAGNSNGGSSSSQNCAAFNQWPQIKGGVTCSACTALVSTGSNGGRCDTYCQSFGHECASAAEEQNNNCEVKYTSSCNQTIVGTSDMLCTCHKAKSVKPSTSSQRIEVSGRQLLVNGRPLHLKGVAWNPVKKGGGHPDGLDMAGTVARDADLMARAGINAVRTYVAITDIVVLDALWARGIWVINSVYNYGGTRVEKVADYVNVVKNHPSILMWTIGNEWNYNGFYTGIGFSECVSRINQVARVIKQHDTTHPIATIYGGLKRLDEAMGSFANTIDLVGLNVYSGIGFGNLFDRYSGISSKPMFLGEYGADAYNSNVRREDQQAQADATGALTREINDRTSVRQGGVCVGGFVFEFADEWWKDDKGSRRLHDVGGIAPGGGPHPDFTFNEEWWGLVTIDREPRLAYQTYAQIPVPV